MKYIDEFRDKELAKRLVNKINSSLSSKIKIMEVCGGQTHTIMKYGLEQLMSKNLDLLHGPGCPVCVTPINVIDKALEIASKQNVIFTSFGDMLRVPGTEKDLLKLKSEGYDIRIVYSPLDSLKIANENPDKNIVFFGIGFETTAPLNAFTILEAKRNGIKNFSMLSSHYLVPPVIEKILSDKENIIQGFLAAGHVCTIMGYEEYEIISKKFNVPIVVTGFEPIDILDGISSLIDLINDKKNTVINQYKRSVNKKGNEIAKINMFEIFEIIDKEWRGIGKIEKSGLKIKKIYRDYDAEIIYNLPKIESRENNSCIAGSILMGHKKPFECEMFSYRCTPQNPLGSPMVSQEGACNAYYQFKK